MRIADKEADSQGFGQIDLEASKLILIRSLACVASYQKNFLVPLELMAYLQIQSVAQELQTEK